MFKVFVLGLMVLGLAACAPVPFASSNSHGYLKSRNAPKLVVPPPLQQDEISSFYFLPEAEGNKRVSIRP